MFHCHFGLSISIIRPQNFTEDFTVSKAIVDICDGFFIRESVKFDLIIFGESTVYLNNIADRVLQAIGRNFSTTVKRIENIVNWNGILENSALVLFKNLTYLAAFNSKLIHIVSSPPQVTKFLIHCQFRDNVTLVNMISYYESDMPHISSFEYFINNKHSSIDLVTLEHFLEDSCNIQVGLIINTFNKTSLRWAQDFRNHEKFRNFNGCLLTLTSEYNLNFHLSKYNYEIVDCLKQKKDEDFCFDIFSNILKRPDVNYHGLFYEAFEMLSRRGNFTPNYQFLIEGRKFTKSGIFINQKIGFEFAAIHENIVTHAPVFIDISFKMLVTPSEFYTNYEKLLLPFDAKTWTCLIFVFTSIAIVILALKFTPKNMQSLVFGHGTKTPGLNIIRIFFGAGQTKLPQESIL